MDDVMATLKIFAGNFAPRGWAFCEGQLLAISQNSALFSLLGTIYGGDGRTTFALPDLRGRASFQPGNGPGLSSHNLGAKGGAERNTITNATLPNHSHVGGLHVSNADSTVSTPEAGNSIGTPGAISGRNFVATNGFVAGAPDVVMSGTEIETAHTGGSQSVNNVQPFLAMNYIICMQGIYPSRN
jgi:microcystin-dependent protein